jgi:hypothetical protein
VNRFDAATKTLCAVFDALAQRQLFRDPSDGVNLPKERVFIVSWVDCYNKYGKGYVLTDGPSPSPLISSPLFLTDHFIGHSLLITGTLVISCHADKVRCMCAKTTLLVTIRRN